MKDDASQDIQQDIVAESLKKAEGFIGTAEQDHYDECEEAVMGMLSHVRKVGRQWKVNNLVLVTID
jgi:centromere/kinetochore protein ZW10